MHPADPDARTHRVLAGIGRVTALAHLTGPARTEAVAAGRAGQVRGRWQARRDGR